MDPLLANSVYLAGYIEQVRTGTNVVIDRYLELGLRKSEFRQDEGFRVMMWRREAAGMVESDPERLNVSERQVRAAIDELQDIRMRRKGKTRGEWEIIG